MSDFTIKRAPATVRDGDPTADEIFRVPSVEEVRKAGYENAEAFQESIRIRYADLKRRFETDAVFRAETIRECAAAKQRDADERAQENRSRRGRR